MSVKAPLQIFSRLIEGLPSKQRKQLLNGCEPVDLVFGNVLHEANQPIRHVYFPLSGFVSLVTTLDGHQPLEMGLIGNEGMLGATLALGIGQAPMRAVVQGSGSALRISSQLFKQELLSSPALLRALKRYLYVVMTQLSQSAACTHFHEIEPRLARWLLMTHDRAHADHFHLTHEYLADMLGVRRSGVSIAAAAMQARGLISYSRGEIHILDRAGLELAACECYAALQADYRAQF
ncbi:cAMP-binding proteins - catabolite gene activator and regulatory subunit of cAMP-dependent protein kinases [Pseudomonas sp. 9AZ]|jgi:CRP-like cAMP-binding protein|uniref:Crp/Fnr family transcriptional regulator n=1 Tax=Pseudomonas TaxID=286 RepID=UPI000CABC377|nr:MULTISPECIES: Crp/Fnr family transcriptional regulator [Pseudomonas]MDR7026516.1 CRP-like cAMP-binding protein [Pseudomonas peli]PJE41993.1 MAG: Crp/Fnr family transcriptional regulator [Pseudomonas sp.] [Pseudomonas sp. FEMGT703P]VXC94221.1 cAMP-binding proteins - catabolite gene activator and regulatory subunit of cAMP-dependent protein kinases [Pseudomonas sp. 9AZ]